MQTKEQQIAAILLPSTDIKAARWATDSNYLVVLSGPELHTVGSPRRNRKVWVNRLVDVKTGIASGGFCWNLTEKEAREQFGRF